MSLEGDLKRKQKLLAKAELEISKRASRIEKNIIRSVLAKLFEIVDFRDNPLKKATATTRVVKEITKIFNEIAQTLGKDSILFVINQLDKLSGFEAAYFQNLSDKSAKQVQRLITKTNKDLDKTFGITRYKNGNVKAIAENSVLAQYASSQNLQKTIAQEITSAVLSGQDKTFIKNRMNKIVGGRVSEDLTDLVYAKSRLETKELGDALGLDKYYIYNGTEVDTSRPFCAGGIDKKSGEKFPAKKGQVFTIEEIESWRTQTWEGKPPNYDPFNPFMGPGGYNCRDVLSPINKRSAIMLRPELENL